MAAAAVVAVVAAVVTALEENQTVERTRCELEKEGYIGWSGGKNERIESSRRSEEVICPLD